MGKHTYYYTYDCWAQAQDMPAGYGGHIIDSLVSCGRNTVQSSRARIASNEYYAHGGALLCRESSVALRREAATGRTNNERS
mgnify:CR=1 FL=1